MPSRRRQTPRPHKRGTRIEPAQAPTRTAPPKLVPTSQAGRSRPSTLLIAGCAVALAVACVVAAHVMTSGEPREPDVTVSEAPPEEATVSFVAVGDNLPETEIARYADALAGEPGDGLYDYAPIYEPVRDYIESADLAYVKEETHLGGDDLGPAGYPSFNTTDAMADAIVETGFDLVGSASNHAYDWGYFGANEHSRKVWNSKPVVFVGTATNEQEASQIATIEKNGITFALLDYTYGVNGYDEEDLPGHAVNYMHKDRIEADVARAHEVADVVLVAMHWGTENLMEADETQLDYAQFLADLGVDVVLGSHPHVIGPLAWVEGEGGNRTLVAYSLGNFLSNHPHPGPRNELEGMLSCNFVRDAETGEVSVENVSWTPLVMHTDGASFAVYAVRDYTAELAAAHPVLSTLDDPLTWLRDTSEQVVNSLGDSFPIDA